MFRQRSLRLGKRILKDDMRYEYDSPVWSTCGDGLSGHFLYAGEEHVVLVFALALPPLTNVFMDVKGTAVRGHKQYDSCPESRP